MARCLLAWPSEAKVAGRGFIPPHLLSPQDLSCSLPGKSRAASVGYSPPLLLERWGAWQSQGLLTCQGPFSPRCSSGRSRA